MLIRRYEGLVKLPARRETTELTINPGVAGTGGGRGGKGGTQGIVGT